MVNNKFNKKGQAAIEFLMTYGWMLLVVLIVGALVFSFVDFGSLLPDKIDVSTQSIRTDSANSAAYGSTYSSASDQNMIYVGFTYTGGQKASISPEDGSMITDLGKKCYPIKVTNERLTTSQIANRNITDGTISNYTGTAPEFLSGHPGTIQFDCNVNASLTTSEVYMNRVGDLLANDVLEGQLSIGIKDVKRGTGARAIPNGGSFRISIK